MEPTFVAPRPELSPAVRHHVGSAAIVLWLLAVLFAYNWTPEGSQLAQKFALIGILPIGALLGGTEFLFPLVYRRDGPLALAVGLFLLVAFVSSLVAPDPTLSLGYWGLTAVGFLICAGVWSLPGDLCLTALRGYAVIGAAALLALLLTTDSEGARFDAIRNPNSIGLISLSLVASAFALRNRALRAATILAALTVILATWSRSAVVASLIVIAVMTRLSWSESSPRARLVVAGSVLLGAAPALLLAGDEIRDVLLKLLAIEDPYRGLGTGFTRRVSGWEETLAMWRRSPWFGVGYRSHEGFMRTLSSAHSGYLALLAEVGVVGVVIAAFVLVRGLRRLMHHLKRSEHAARIGAALLAGYFFVSIWERFLINFGNPTSILALMFLLMPPPPAEVETGHDQEGSRWAPLRPRRGSRL